MEKTLTLKELTNLWERNRQAIEGQCGIGELECSLHLKNGKIIYSCENCPPQYRKSLGKLLNQILWAAMDEIGKAFSYPASEEQAKARIQQYMHGRLTDLLGMLLEKGYEPFREMLDAATAELKQALSLVEQAFSFPVADDAERTRVQEYVGARFPAYLRTLLKEGYASFEESVRKSAAIMEFSSTAASIHEENGRWINCKGEAFSPETGCWEKGNGETFSDPLSNALWALTAQVMPKRKSPIL